jgi:hypothetical protein
LGGAAFAVSVGVAWLDLTSFEQYIWVAFASARPAEAADQPAAVATVLLDEQVAVSETPASHPSAKARGTGCYEPG